MRPLLPALLALLCMPATVAAQELSAEADKAMWCGAAYAVMQQATTGSAAGALGDKADAAFAKAAAELIAAGMTVEEFGALAETYASRLVAPFRTGGFTLEACDALIK